MFRDFVRQEDGATMVEYALMVALIAIVVIAAAKVLGTNTSTILHSAGSVVGS